MTWSTVLQSSRPQIVGGEEPQNAEMRFLPVGHLMRTGDLVAGEDYGYHGEKPPNFLQRKMVQRLFVAIKKNMEELELATS